MAPTPPTNPPQNPQQQTAPVPYILKMSVNQSQFTKEKMGDQLINNDAGRVAQSAGQKDKIKSFSDRLRGDAADWHGDYIEHATNKEDYDAWEKALINRF